MICPGCNLSYQVDLRDNIPISPGRSVSGWCHRCDGVLNLGTKKSIVSIIIDGWIGDYEAEKQNALDYLDKTEV